MLTLLLGSPPCALGRLPYSEGSRFQLDTFVEALKALLIGVVEGVTEWLPISSTGHMILVDEFVKLDVSAEFLALFLVVIQLGAIMAVVLLYFHKLNPFSRKKTASERRFTWRLWGMVAIGCIPAAVFGFALDDWVNEHFYNAFTVAIALIFYGVVFIAMEAWNRRRERALLSEGPQRARAVSHDLPRGKHARITLENGEQVARGVEAQVGPGDDGDIAERALFKISDVDDIDWKTAIKIGLFQVLAIIPGTSRSGSTIIGGMLCGCSRTAAAEFTFFLAIPVMFGWGLVKAVKYIAGMGASMTQVEAIVLVVGILSAFAVSIASIKFLMGYIKNNDFTAFGIYRIVLGIAVIAFFAITGDVVQPA